MIETEIIELKGGAALGYRHLLGNKPPWLVIIQGEKGYLATEYLNKEFVDRIGDACAIVEGAKDFDDMLNGIVSWVSQEAEKLGVKVGMQGRDALRLML